MYHFVLTVHRWKTMTVDSCKYIATHHTNSAACRRSLSRCSCPVQYPDIRIQTHKPKLSGSAWSTPQMYIRHSPTNAVKKGKPGISKGNAGVYVTCASLFSLSSLMNWWSYVVEWDVGLEVRSSHELDWWSAVLSAPFSSPTALPRTTTHYLAQA